MANCSIEEAGMKQKDTAARFIYGKVKLVTNGHLRGEVRRYSDIWPECPLAVSLHIL